MRLQVGSLHCDTGTVSRTRCPQGYGSNQYPGGLDSMLGSSEKKDTYLLPKGTYTLTGSEVIVDCPV